MYLRFRRYSMFLLLALMLLFIRGDTSPIFEPAWWLWVRMAT